MKIDLLFCLFGRGSIGTRHLKNLKALSYDNIIAFSESYDKKKDEEYKTKYGVETFHNLEEVKQIKPDVFIIANPTSMHMEYAEIAVNMNSHIFMEKPLSHSLTGIEELKNEIYNRDLIFFLANNLRFHPVLIKIKRLIEEGGFGDIYFARIMAGQHLPDWHPWEDYRRSYSARKDLGGGVVLTLQHEIDYAYWLFGNFKSYKSYVKKVSNLEIDVEDIASIVIETESGPLIEIHLDYLQRPAKRDVQIQGAKGSIDYCFGESSLQFYDFEGQIYKNILDIKDYQCNQMYIDEMKHFIDCINYRKKSLIGIDDAIYTLRACLDIKKGVN